MSSGKIVVIVESPAKCKNRKFSGSEYICVASYGHLRELKTLKDIDKKFNPTFTTSRVNLIK